jgi:hypothetical protein
MHTQDTYSFGNRFYRPEGIEKVHAYGQEIAERFIHGSSTIRPSDAAAFLLCHEVEANNSYIRGLRNELAADLDVLHPEEAPSADAAARVGMGIREIIRTTNACAVTFIAQDIVVAESFRLIADPTLLHQD